MSDAESSGPPRWADLSVAVLAIALLVYSVLRARDVCLTIDEAKAFVNYASAMSYGEIATTFTTAANHLLNTLGMKASASLFGPAEWALRLPSLIAHAVFLLASILLLRRFSSPVYVGGFVILNLNPYLLDFFSVARGYGIAAAATLASLACFLALVRSGRPGNLVLGLVIAAIGVLGNFALLHYYLSLVIALNLYLVGERWSRVDEDRASDRWVLHLLRHNVGVLVVSAALAAAISDPIRQLRASGELYFGGQDGFWQNTVGSLVFGFLYDSARRAGPYTLHIVLHWVTGAVTVMIAASVLLRARAGKRVLRDPAFYAFGCLVLPALSAFFQFHLMDTRYVILRTALFFVPLFVVSLCFALERLTASRRAIGIAVVVLLASGFTLQTARKMNTWRVFEWAWCFDIRAFGDELATVKRGREQVVVIHWLYRRVLEYYREHRGYAWILPVPLTPRTLAEPRLEHYLTFDQDLGKFPVGFAIARKYDRWVTPTPGSPLWMRRLDVMPVTGPVIDETQRPRPK